MNSSDTRKARIESMVAAYWKTKEEIQAKLIEIHALIDQGLKEANNEGYMLRLLWQRLERQLDGLRLEGITERMLYEGRIAQECTGLKSGD